MKKPEITSLTSVCAPKPTARPMMPAPVSSGVMSTSSARSTISSAAMVMTVVRKRLSVLPMVWARLRRSMSDGPPPPTSSSTARATMVVTTRFAVMARSTITPMRSAVVAAHWPRCRPSISTGRSTPTIARAGNTSPIIATTNVTRRTRRTGARCMDAEMWGMCVRPSTLASNRRTSPPAIRARAIAMTAANVIATSTSTVLSGMADASAAGCCMGRGASNGGAAGLAVAGARR